MKINAYGACTLTYATLRTANPRKVATEDEQSIKNVFTQNTIAQCTTFFLPSFFIFIK